MINQKNPMAASLPGDLCISQSLGRRFNVNDRQYDMLRVSKIFFEQMHR